MKPATPVTSQLLGADVKCSRRRGYGAEIKRSQWKSTRHLIQGSRARERDRSIIRAASRGHPRRRDKASSIPRIRYLEFRIKSWFGKSLAMT